MDFFEYCTSMDQTDLTSLENAQDWATQHVGLTALFEHLPKADLPSHPERDWHSMPPHQLVVFFWDYELQVSIFAVPESVLVDPLPADLTLLNGARLTVGECTGELPEMAAPALRVQQAMGMLTDDEGELEELIESLEDLCFDEVDMPSVEDLVALFSAWRPYYVGATEFDGWCDEGADRRE